jgi:hypothetical protein
MILDALIKQFRQRFNYEKRAEVCLWFDEAREFERLLGPFQAHLANVAEPPIQLFAYDPEQNRGQLWLRQQHFEHYHALPENDRKQQRYVFYFPFSEDLWDRPQPDGPFGLEFLQCYRLSGVTWRINGKKPTLFSFLRGLDVPLPTQPGEQRKLFEGGSESLLSRYTTKFYGQPEAFWRQAITPRSAQESLLGDLSGAILKLSCDPDRVWEEMAQQGVLTDFLEAAKERLGFSSETDSAVLWLHALAESLALNETYLNFGEPDDFPFADRLPPYAKRIPQLELLQRWLRDAEARPAWDQLVTRAEKHINLASWARGKTGRSFGFPHLVQARWSNYKTKLETITDKAEAVRAFAVEESAHIKTECEQARASFAEGAKWDFLQSLCLFIDSIEKAKKQIDTAKNAADLAQLFVRLAKSIDRQYWKLVAAANEHNTPAVASIAGRFYTEYATLLNDRFFEHWAVSDSPEISKLEFVTDFVEHSVWQISGKRAVIIVDAFRLDCAYELQAQMAGGSCKVTPLRAALPTRTPVGMSALLPKDLQPESLVVKGNELYPMRDGRSFADRKNRLSALESFGAQLLSMEDAVGRTNAPDKAGKLLVVYGHETLDSMGHGNDGTLIRYMEDEIRQLLRLVKKLHAWGYPQVHIITDHGFVLFPPEWLPKEVPFDKDWSILQKERFAITKRATDVPLIRKSCPWNEEFLVAVPPGLAFFKTEKAFSHGGAALQEMVISHFVSTVHTTPKTFDVRVELESYQLNRAALRVVLGSKAESSQDGDLFEQPARTLEIKVNKKSSGLSVLPNGQSKVVSLAWNEKEKAQTVFFDSKHSFVADEQLVLSVSDKDTGEKFPAGGIILTIARDL